MKLKDNLSNKLSAPNQGNDNHLSEDKTNAGDFKVLLNQLAVNEKRKSEKKRMEKYFDKICEIPDITAFIKEKTNINQMLLTTYEMMLLILIKLKENKDIIEKILVHFKENCTIKENFTIKELISLIIISESTKFKEIGKSTFEICKIQLKYKGQSKLIANTWEQTRANLAKHNSLKYEKPLYISIFIFSNSKKSHFNCLPYSVLSENLTPFLNNRKPKNDKPKCELNWNKTRQSNCSIL